ncbi:hypothetical protein RUM44_001628 [Polyplax serrata]|uniref:Pseudouridine synthase I TruA alpha/beta domain-containing protein n=1 Tax=Polyplax serrata TaxID=468196 RepID=A0ABR1AKJ5_POLSC
MNEPEKKIFVTKRKKDKRTLTREDLKQLSQEELVEKILQLEAHNLQLQSILQKRNINTAKECGKSKNFDFSKVSTRHIFLKFYYFGWDYQGFVTQEDTNNTIEYFLFQALEKCCLIQSRETSNYHRCGRTDKGVSAFCQVISIDVRSKLSDPNENNVNEEFPYCKMLNRILPDNIRCYAWAPVGQNVSARFDCSQRTYKYFFPKGDLNIKAMQEAADYIIGTHDFRNFCKMDVGNGVVEFEREIKAVEIKESLSPQDQSGYQMFEFVITGRGFLWHQIRCFMSILLLVGQGKESPDVVNKLLNVTENPTKPQYSLASHLPLNLYDVSYEPISINWNVDDENLIKIIELLQSQWSNGTIKSTMIKHVINDLEKLQMCSSVIEKQAESLTEGVKSKIYKPLLTRMKCETLENKINHYVKKRKLEIGEIESEQS